VQFNCHFCSIVEQRIVESALAMGPIWGENERPPLAAQGGLTRLRSALCLPGLSKLQSVTDLQSHGYACGTSGHKLEVCDLGILYDE